jgi:hypothetical protein
MHNIWNLQTVRGMSFSAEGRHSTGECRTFMSTPVSQNRIESASECMVGDRLARKHEMRKK